MFYYLYINYVIYLMCSPRQFLFIRCGPGKPEKQIPMIYTVTQILASSKCFTKQLTFCTSLLPDNQSYELSLLSLLPENKLLGSFYGKPRNSSENSSLVFCFFRATLYTKICVHQGSPKKQKQKEQMLLDVQCAHTLKENPL